MAGYNLNATKSNEGRKMVKISPVIPEDLAVALEERYLAERMTMSEFVAKAVAAALGRPELGEMPRVPRGRRAKRREPQEASAP